MFCGGREPDPVSPGCQEPSSGCRALRAFLLPSPSQTGELESHLTTVCPSQMLQKATGTRELNEMRVSLQGVMATVMSGRVHVHPKRAAVPT